MNRKVDMDVVYARTVAELQDRLPQHPLLELNEKEQREFIDLLLEGQGYYIKEGIRNGEQQIALPGLGTFLYNPLRKIAYTIRKKFKETLYKFEIDQLIKENLVAYFETHGDPFSRQRAEVFELEKDTIK